MYAIIETGGKQYRVELGSEIEVERLPAEPGSEVVLERVLLVADDGSAAIGQPFVAGASVRASVVRQDRAEKIVVFKYRPKARHRAKRGHRQELTVLRIADIVHEGTSAAAAAVSRTQASEAEREKAKAAAAEQAARDAATAAELARKTAAARAAETKEPVRPRAGTARTGAAKPRAEAAKPRTGAAKTRTEAPKPRTEPAKATGGPDETKPARRANAGSRASSAKTNDNGKRRRGRANRET